jgi:hypothetical protein
MSLARQKEAHEIAGNQYEADLCDRAPTVHLGPTVTAMERKAKAEFGRDYEPVTDRAIQNQQIINDNTERWNLKQQIREIENAIGKRYLELKAIADEVLAAASARAKRVAAMTSGLTAQRKKKALQALDRSLKKEEGPDYSSEPDFEPPGFTP